MKHLIAIRIEKEQVNRLKDRSNCCGLTTTQLIRKAIDEVLTIGYDLSTKEEVIKTVKWLRQKIRYINTPEGKKEAMKQKEIRERIALRIINIFELEGEG